MLRPDPSVDVMMAVSPIRVVVDEKERPKLSVPLVKDELPMVVELEFQERPELSLPLVTVLALDPFMKVDDPLRLTV